MHRDVRKGADNAPTRATGSLQSDLTENRMPFRLIHDVNIFSSGLLRSRRSTTLPSGNTAICRKF